MKNILDLVNCLIGYYFLYFDVVPHLHEILLWIYQVKIYLENQIYTFSFKIYVYNSNFYYHVYHVFGLFYVIYFINTNYLQSVLSYFFRIRW